MLAEFLSGLINVAQEAKSHEVDVKPFPNDPDKHLVTIDGVQTELATPRQPPDPKSNVQTVADFAAAYMRKFGDKVEAAAPEVWYTIKSAQFFLDEPACRQSVTLAFVESEVWRTIRTLKAATVLNQTKLVRLLRHDFGSCNVGHVLAAFRTLNFSIAKNARANVQHGNQSMDADLVAKVDDGKPEYFNLQFHPFSSPELASLECSVSVTVDIDAQAETITLQIVPDDVERIELLQRDTVARKLADELPEGTTILAGTP